MRSIVSILVLASALALPAAAQEASAKFPIGQPFKVVSISGFDVQNAGMTFSVERAPQGNGFVGRGNAGCNTWTATAILADRQVEFAEIATTKKMCPKPRMTSEGAFLTALRSAQRWHIDGKNRLVVEGEAARLLLTGAAAARQGERKPAK